MELSKGGTEGLGRDEAYALLAQSLAHLRQEVQRGRSPSSG